MSKIILFRCSKLGALMTDPKLKTDKEAGNLSETAKTFVEEMWLEREYGYREKVMTDEMKKGLLCEQDSMGLVTSVLGGEFRSKHKGRISNDNIIGEPDIVLKNEDVVEDVKSSYNLRTFMNAEVTKDYNSQAQGYMDLTGKNNYRLIFCLVPTPKEIIESEEKRLWYKFGCSDLNPDYLEMVEQLNHNNDVINTIPKEQRIKVFAFQKDEAFLSELYRRCEKAKQYYNSLFL